MRAVAQREQKMNATITCDHRCLSSGYVLCLLAATISPKQTNNSKVVPTSSKLSSRAEWPGRGWIRFASGARA